MAPFAWEDGPLIKAMRDGDILLVDELSLAEDSVLERLNSAGPQIHVNLTVCAERAIVIIPAHHTNKLAHRGLAAAAVSRAFNTPRTLSVSRTARIQSESLHTHSVNWTPHTPYRTHDRSPSELILC